MSECSFRHPNILNNRIDVLTHKRVPFHVTHMHTVIPPPPKYALNSSCIHCYLQRYRSNMLHVYMYMCGGVVQPTEIPRRTYCLWQHTTYCTKVYSNSRRKLGWQCQKVRKQGWNTDDNKYNRHPYVYITHTSSAAPRLRDKAVLTSVICTCVCVCVCV